MPHISPACYTPDELDQEALNGPGAAQTAILKNYVSSYCKFSDDGTPYIRDGSYKPLGEVVANSNTITLNHIIAVLKLQADEDHNHAAALRTIIDQLEQTSVDARRPD